MKKLLSCIVFIVYLLVGQTERVLAQGDPFGSGSLNGLSVATGSRDIFDIVINIVNIVLYFLGGIAVLLGLYAGWLWFTSRGNAEQIKKAKGILVSAVIGLAIIFASYGIANFVVGTLYNNIVGDGASGDEDDSDDGTAVVACPPPMDGGMLICALSPTSNQVGSYVTISGWNFGAYVDAATSKVSFIENTTAVSTDASLVSCGTSPYWRQRFVSGTNIYYQVKAIVPNVPNTAPDNSYSVMVENTVDSIQRSDSHTPFVALAGVPGLNIACLVPDEGPTGTAVTAYGINFGTTGTRNIFMTGWDGTAATQIPVAFDNADWTDTEIRFTIPNTALAGDIIISNDAITVDPSDSEFFKVTCGNDGDCDSECCSIGECRPASICSGVIEISGPHIDYITPDNGAEDNLLTIQGSSFGTTYGQVLFSDASGVVTPAQLPSGLNSACSDLWTDTNIIVGVPDLTGDGAGVYTVTVLPSGSTVPSNGVSFVINTTNRPGICLADPVAGSLNTEVEITGVSFVDAVGNTVKYGGIVGYNTSINETTDTATSNVPNLRTGLVGIQLNDGLNLSNPYPFNITETLAGDPSIVNITPTAGPTGTYLTINGTNFGDTKGDGNVLFDNVSGDFSFPLQCSSSVWSSSLILVKVPTGLVVGEIYEVKVIRSDGKESNTKEFTFTTGIPGPGLCYMYPDNGPKNSLVSFYGDNFGTTAGQIKFYNNQNSSVIVGTSLWGNNNALYMPVPDGAETGPVVVVSADAQESNAFNFSVSSCNDDGDCNTAISEICCENSIGNYCALNCSNTLMCTYGWTFQTVPTPTTPLEVIAHWPACDSSCGNAEIGVGFNVLLDDASATLTTNYTITDVTNPASPVNVAIDSITLTENEGAEVPATVVLDYAGTLLLNHTYGVTVSQGILSFENERLTWPYYWEFTVGQGTCVFTGVSITPLNYTALRPSQTVDYYAAPTADVSICGVQRLICDTCEYAWGSSDVSVATIQETGSANTSALTTSSIIPATGDTTISCEIRGTTISNNTNLYIDYTVYVNSLLMTAHYPDCDEACLNAIVGMTFNTQLDAASVANINNLVRIMDTYYIPARNVTAGVFVDINQASGSVVRIEHQPFVSGHRYVVSIAVGLTNVFGSAYTGGGWDFTVGAEECLVTGASVIPTSATATIGQSVSYSAQATSNTDLCGYMPVNCDTCTYNWSSVVPAVATISGTAQTARAMSVSTGATTIQCAVTQGARSLPVIPGELTITGPIYSIPRIEDYSPSLGALEQCRNTAIEIVFSEKMNLDSIRNNLKLYNSSDIVVPGTYAFATVDGPDTDLVNNETKVIFLPTELLVANSQYHISLGTGIVSLNNMALDLIDPDLDPWVFTTGTEICQISYVLTNPSEDWFTCGGNTCEGDDVATTDGNQHYYSAIAYSRQATAISGVDYAWQVSPNEESVDLNTLVGQEVIATAGENGQASVSVTASGNISGVDLGTASASLPVTVFLCQDPWPGLSSFPWIETALNFSTYYCQQFTEGSPILPDLGAPVPSAHASTILQEYIFTVNIAGDTPETNFIIFRIMPNAGHLSVKEWYKEKFPGDAVGTMSMVDGYEAMRVGNTTYISAANIADDTIYTNIYIIAYSIGANAQTKNIYDQLVANFQLNTNSDFSTINDDNLCSGVDSDDVVRVCSTDFDCPTGTICRSRSLKLRRDVKRLTDLLPIKKYTEQYGVAHKACSQNAQISCVSDAQCGVGNTCVNYYPQLNAGTFVPGQSNSKWPSWQQTLATDLKQTLPVDPINKFSTCPLEGADPETCWNEATRKFQCSTDSYIYGYQLLDGGRSYRLDSHFEYDPVQYNSTTFYDDLYNGVSAPGIVSIGNIRTILDLYCTETPVMPDVNTCGNGVVDTGEECDGGFSDNQCDDILFPEDWWNEQITGCNPPGTIDQCQWYDRVLTAEICGGYCRDNKLQTVYENCDIVNTRTVNNGFFHCPSATVPGTYILATNNCNSSCNVVCADTLPAAKCGDGVWTSGREACDVTGSPNGLAGWDCPDNGNVLCVPPGTSLGCSMLCDNGTTPYQGICGDGIVQAPENCDYADYTTPLPSVATATNAYTCSTSCNFVNQPYCGDNILQYDYREFCDTTLLTTVRPAQSSEFNQYQCRMVNDADLVTHPRYTRCTPTIGGYCGDGLVQGDYGELCDPLGYVVTAVDSSPTNQYVCDDDCMSIFGGYCGDGLVQTAYEQCDLGESVVKRADVVFVFDMSASMESSANNFCSALTNVVTSLVSNNVDFRITIMPLGDSPNNDLTPSTADNIDTIFTVNQYNTDGTTCSQYSSYFYTQLPGAVRTFNTLVPNCSLPVVTTPNSIRYLSFYNTDYNNISTTLAPVVATNCVDMTYPATGMCVLEDEYAGNIENWGYATERIARGYQWQSGYQRIIVPVSDEYAWCGGNTTIFTNDDNYGPSVTSGWLYNAVQQAKANNVHISPVFLNSYTPAVEAATNVANDTGGLLISSNTGWNTNIMHIVNSAFCDGNGDGVMDCSFP